MKIFLTDISNNDIVYTDNTSGVIFKDGTYQIFGMYDTTKIDYDNVVCTIFVCCSEGYFDDVDDKYFDENYDPTDMKWFNDQLIICKNQSLDVNSYENNFENLDVY